MFRSPKPIAAPPPPTIDQARIAAEAADDLARRRGRAATFVAGAQDRLSGMTATKMLTGQGG